MGEVTLQIGTHDLCVIQYAVSQQIKRVSREYEVLRLTRDRDLTRTERDQLPGNISQMTREELRDQIDSYYTLLLTYQHWADEMERLAEEARARDAAEREALKVVRTAFRAGIQAGGQDAAGVQVCESCD